MTKTYYTRIRGYATPVPHSKYWTLNVLVEFESAITDPAKADRLAGKLCKAIAKFMERASNSVTRGRKKAK